MKVMIKPSVAPGGKSLMLCDDDGNPLPMQVSCEVRCGMDGPDKVLVEFVIDGDKVRFSGEDETN